jgi:hypothetical protein
MSTGSERGEAGSEHTRAAEPEGGEEGQMLCKRRMLA